MSKVYKFIRVDEILSTNGYIQRNHIHENSHLKFILNNEMEDDFILMVDNKLTNQHLTKQSWLKNYCIYLQVVKINPVMTRAAEELPVLPGSGSEVPRQYMIDRGLSLSFTKFVGRANWSIIAKIRWHGKSAKAWNSIFLLNFRRLTEQFAITSWLSSRPGSGPCRPARGSRYGRCRSRADRRGDGRRSCSGCSDGWRT